MNQKQLIKGKTRTKIIKPIEDSSWTKFIKHINTYSIGWTIFRPDLIKFLYDKDGLKGKVSETTVDQYRRTLTWLGYLKEVERADGTIMRGKYKVVKPIPESLPSSIANKEKRTNGQNPDNQGEI